jgi:hypothetical protein
MRGIEIATVPPEELLQTRESRPAPAPRVAPRA